MALTLDSLTSLFPPAADLIAQAQPIQGSEMPQPYRSLLVHEHHMTVTVEAHHGQLVDVVVLDRKREGDSYARKILLKLRKTGKVVQFGLVRIHLHFCAEEIREEILSERTPLGRVLINHGVMRRIEPTEYLRVTPGPQMCEWFGVPATATAYGRLAIIHCDHQPAIELLEIVAP